MVESDRGQARTQDETPAETEDFSAPPSLERPDQLEADRVRAALRRKLFGTEVEAPRLGRYELEEQIGEGAMGGVFVARDVELRRRVALKVIRAQSSGERGASMRRRLLREARAMAKLRHPNVVVVFDAGLVDDQAFIAMELVEGRTLREWLADEDRPWEAISSTFVKAGRGLAAAHEQGLVHRDFKPDNVLIARDGRVLVTDFGLARATEGAEEGLDTATSATGQLDKTGWTRAGTPRYMAPEQHSEGQVDARADQFAFCVALFEAIYGEPPFEGETFAERLEAARAGRLRRPEVGRRVPRWLHRVLLRGLEAEPDDRFPTMAAALVELQTEARSVRSWLVPAAAGIALAAGAYALGQMSGPGAAQASAGRDSATPPPALVDDRAVVSAGALASAAVAKAANAVRAARSASPPPAASAPPAPATPAPVTP